ncbi:carbohydrate ABC transporter permease [Paenibacillus sp. Soil787]|uniref:carbohydrate ABC transporter permease n=1 Tax=Paenibacillus sp. Soil787 TaxID=1736411 RepID=UPI0006FBA9AB|nr:carbohydrate ABC transporter permease [Paenibacillus sp. Soil787]KRF43666.1 sugar ABC transporter ATP-binding protein [Paenibacillus sp. Soil787]
MGTTTITKTVITVIMGLLSLLFLSPLLWMISAASKIEKDVMAFPIQWIPTDWNFINNFKTVWMGTVPFGLNYFNSLKIACILTLLTLLFSSMAGFAFAKLNFPFKNQMFILLLSFYLVPAESTLVPRFIMIKWLGLYNTHAALILMGAFSIALTFLMRQFMLSIHHEYLEAAKIDGAGFLRIYWQIALPMAKPIVATVGILKFLWTWNDYQNPLIFLMNKKLFTIPLGMGAFKDEYATSYAITMMASVSAIIPLVIIFILLQKQVINGIAGGGVKG